MCQGDTSHSGHWFFQGTNVTVTLDLTTKSKTHPQVLIQSQTSQIKLMFLIYGISARNYFHILLW